MTGQTWSHELVITTVPQGIVPRTPRLGRGLQRGASARRDMSPPFAAAAAASPAIERGGCHHRDMIRVAPAEPEWAKALVEGDAVFSERFGIPVEAGWFVFPEAFPLLVDAARRAEPDRWGLHLLFDDDGALVGNGGWKGPPVSGVAELGYAVAPARRERGVATSAVRELISHARVARLRTVVAHTLADTSASTAVLTRCGFTKVSDLVDPDNGRVWRWEVELKGDPTSSPNP
jgi:[ribosomal protein S5]-alanine N-acetyltransferase